MNNTDKGRAAEGSKARPTLYPKLRREPATGEPWKPVMTEQERRAQEQYVKDNNLPF